MSGAVPISLLLEGFSVLVVLVSLTFICLKIKSTKRNPEFLGVAGTLVVKNPDEEEAASGMSSSGGRQLPAPPQHKAFESSSFSSLEDIGKKEDDVPDGCRKDHPEEEEENNNNHKSHNEDNLLCEGESEHLYSKVAPAIIQEEDKEHPYAQLESLPKGGREHEYATLGEKNAQGGGDEGERKAAATYMTLSEANSEETYAAIEGTYAMIEEAGGSKRPSVDESGYTLVNKAKKKNNIVNTTSNNPETLYAQVEKVSETKSQAAAPVLEDMYAKVSKQREGPLYEETTSDGYEILRDKVSDLSRKDSANYEILPDFRSSVALRRQDSSVGYETVPLEGPWNAPQTANSSRRCYESLRGDPYETVSRVAAPSVDTVNEVRPHPLGRADPPYAELLKDEEEEEGYETIPRMESKKPAPLLKKDSEYDPAYEVVTKAHSEPAYETIESKCQAFDEEELEEGDFEGPLIYMSVQETSGHSSSPEATRRASVVVIQRRPDVSEDGSSSENNTHPDEGGKEINTHIFV